MYKWFMAWSAAFYDSATKCFMMLTTMLVTCIIEICSTAQNLGVGVGEDKNIKFVFDKILIVICIY